MKRSVQLEANFMTLGQLLKYADVIHSGGMAKAYLDNFYVYVNDQEEQRRGRKLYAGDVVKLPNENLTILIQSSHDED